MLVPAHEGLRPAQLAPSLPAAALPFCWVFILFCNNALLLYYIQRIRLGWGIESGSRLGALDPKQSPLRAGERGRDGGIIPWELGLPPAPRDPQLGFDGVSPSFVN